MRKDRITRAALHAQQQILKVVALLEGLKERDNPEELQKELENVQIHYLFPLAECRGALAHALGHARFVSMFSGFTAGERYVNRAWASIVDFHVADCKKEMETAIENFKRAAGNF